MKPELDEILGKYFTGECTPEEIEFVNQWKSEPENFTQFRFLEDSWNQKASDQEKDWSIINQIIDEENGSNPQRTVPIMQRSWLKIAASILVVIGISIIALFWTGDDNSQKLSFEAGENKKIVSLADGSIVDLDKGSTLEVIEFNDQVRELELKGRAYFDVASDQTRPFKVKVGNTTTTVLGTKFCLSHNNQSVEIILEEGAVTFEKGIEKVQLSPNEMVISKDGTDELSKQELAINRNTFSWKTGIIVFDNTTIDEVAVDLQKHYGIEFNFPEAVQGQILNARFEEKSTGQVSKLIGELMELDYTITSKSVDFVNRK